jgi:CRISPR-associated protein Cas5h
MTPEKILIFELFGDYAQFRKFFANMSPLSFSIPPRTVLTGIIGAILGFDKKENPEKFTADNSYIALRLMNPVKKVRIAHNYLKTTSMRQVFDFEEHKPTNVEFLKDVRYRIYFACDNSETYNKLKTTLEDHNSVYTVSLGISGCLANYAYLGEYSITAMPQKQKLHINTIIPMASVEQLVMDEPLSLQKVVLPITMNNEREVTKYDEVLFELTGKPIPVLTKDTAYQVKDIEDIIHEF